jgi:hypothetical protein
MCSVTVGKHGFAGKPDFSRSLFDAEGLAFDFEPDWRAGH